MKHRCDVDVTLTEKLLETLDGELEGFSQESIDLEHDTARVIEKQMRNGWQFDERKAMELAARLRDEQRQVELEVLKKFKPLAVAGKSVEPREKQDGTLSKVGLNCLGDDWQDCGGAFTKVTFPEFNLGSPQQVGRYLQWFGWEPLKFTDNGQPVCDEDVLKHVDIPEAQMILRCKNLSKIGTMVESWIEAQKDDGRIYGYVNSCGAVTGRMSHSGPNLAQVPSRSDIGKECRECFTVRPGYDLVGMDASGLELRMLAHYMKDEAYTKAVVSGSSEDGTDAHTLNMKAAGLKDRDTAKTFIYAFLYGAGDALVAQIAGLKSAAEGRALKQRFLKRTPALKKLKED
jgi:DNA polymerase I-like protein with 3'-5' exonuclease and polymerase domains